VRVPTSALSVATLAVDVAYRARRNPGATGIAAEAQAAVAVRVVRKHADDARRETAPPVRTFLVKLNEALLRLELEAALVDRAPDGVAARVTSVLFRGGATAKGLPTLWVARLERPDAYGLLLKLGARYRFVEGERDDILATLPDHAFADGVHAVSSSNDAQGDERRSESGEQRACGDEHPPRTRRVRRAQIGHDADGAEGARDDEIEEEGARGALGDGECRDDGSLPRGDEGGRSAEQTRAPRSRTHRRPA
jgi:hypothetical protein